MFIGVMILKRFGLFEIGSSASVLQNSLAGTGGNGAALSVHSARRLMPRSRSDHIRFRTQRGRVALRSRTSRSALSRALITGVTSLETDCADVEVEAILSSSINPFIPISAWLVAFLNCGFVLGSDGL